MSSIRGLLLLPLPPQRTTYSHIRTALYPTIRETLGFILKAGGTSGTSVLEVAVPITRLSEETDTHHNLFARVRPLVANIYRLIATTCDELSIPPTGPGSVDVRALFVRDEADPGEGEWSAPLAVLNYAALAVSRRKWTHMFAVESESGEQTFRKFCAIAREHGRKRDALFANVRRVAGGIQIYEPGLSGTCAPNAVLQSTNPFPCGIVVLISGDIADQYSDKHLLTMALFAIPQRAREEQTFVNEGGAQGALHIRVVILKQVLDKDVQMRITEFLSSTTGKVCGGSTQATPDKDALQLRFDTWDGLKTSNGGLEGSFVVSDGTKDLGDILRENGASIVLKPMNGTDD